MKNNVHRPSFIILIKFRKYRKFFVYEGLYAEICLSNQHIKTS